MRISTELSESGRDSSNNLKVSILDDAGVNGSDILRFSIPICLCGTSALNSSTDVKSWGAPLAWGQTGCRISWEVNVDGEVAICHVQGGNPNTTSDMDVVPSEVNAHLAHGDWIGVCNACDPTSYNNRTIEYAVDAEGRLLRRVLDAANSSINSVIIAQNVTGFQAGFGGSPKIVDLTLQLTRTVAGSNSMNMNGQMQVIMRNYD